MATYLTLNQLGGISKGMTFEGSDFSDEQLARFLELGTIQLVDGHEPSTAGDDEKKETPKLAEVKKANKELSDQVATLTADKAAAEAFIEKVKAHVETLGDEEKKAFQDAVNAEAPADPASDSKKDAKDK